MALLQFGLLGLGIGTVYVLIGQGIVLIYRGSGLLNFAQGAIAMLTAQVCYRLELEQGWPTAAAVVAAIALSAAIGAAMQLGVLRSLRDSSGLVRLISTLGLLALIQGLGSVWWGGFSLSAVGFIPSASINFGDGVVVGEDRVILLGISFVLTATLWIVYQRTRFGLATSALAENYRAAVVLGWSPDTISTINWMLGSALAGFAGIVLAPISGLNVTVLTLSVIPGLAAALIGQFSSFWLTFVGGLGIGVLQSELSHYVSQPGWPDSVPFLLVAAMMIVRGRAIPVRGEFLERPIPVGTGRLNLRWGVPMILVGGLLINFLSNSWMLAISSMEIIAIISLSIVLILGYAGQLSLAQVTIAGVAALASGLASEHGHLPFPVCVLFGVIVSTLVGIVVGLPALRCRGVGLAVVTISLSLVIEELILSSPTFNGSVQGITVRPPSIAGFSLDYSSHPVRFTVMVYVMLVLSALAVANIRKGPTGRRLLALRSNERAAASMGVNILGAKLYVFALGSAIAGLGGALAAFQFPQVNLGPYSALTSITSVVNVVVGGVGYIGGALIGGFLGDGTTGSPATQILSYFGGTWFNYLTGLGGFFVLVVLVTNPGGSVDWWVNTIKDWKAKRRIGKPDLKRPGSSPLRPLTESRSTESRRPRVSLKIADLTVRFGAVNALKNVNLVVEPGEVVALIGPNGAGKTTLIDAVFGLVKSTGAIHVGDRELSRLSTVHRARSGIGRTFQSGELFDDMTVLDNILTVAEADDRASYVLDLLRPGRTPLPSTAEEAVAHLELDTDLLRRPEELPAGRRRQIGIARMLASGPSVVLLDEPAAGLDDHEAMELGRLIRHMAEGWGLAVLLVEHNVGLVAEVSDRIVALHLGEVIATGTPREVLEDQAVVTAYLGQSDSGEHSLPVLEDQASTS